MDIFEIIKSAHRKAESVFSEIESTNDSKTLETLFTQLYKQLSVHAKAKELTFYPTMGNHQPIFPKVHKCISGEELKQLATEFQQAQSKLQDEIAVASRWATWAMVACVTIFN